MLDWHLYLIRCNDGSLYTGITTDVARRFAEYQENRGAGAKYLRGRRPLMLIFQKKLGSRSLALGVESKVKKLYHRLEKDDKNFGRIFVHVKH